MLIGAVDVQPSRIGVRLPRSPAASWSITIQAEAFFASVVYSNPRGRRQPAARWSSWGLSSSPYPVARMNARRIDPTGDRKPQTSGQTRIRWHPRGGTGVLMGVLVETSTTGGQSENRRHPSSSKAVFDLSERNSLLLFVGAEH